MELKDPEFRLRYSRQVAVAEIGQEGQRKIIEGKVLIIGCGALGSMVGMQLAGAGVGKIGIADFDTIDISNLQRQFFFSTVEAGELKADVLEREILKLNPLVRVEKYSGMITPRLAKEIFPEYDFIIDATDNPSSKTMTGEESKKAKKVCCIGGVNNFGGQVMTFLPEDSRFEDYFGTVAAEGVLPCSLGGVIGPAAAVCASIQASEALKFLAQTGFLLNGQLLIFNLLNNSFKRIEL